LSRDIQNDDDDDDDDDEKCDTKIIPRNNSSPLHTSELEKGRFSFDFGKRNDRAERIAGNGRDVSFESTTFRAKIALRILVRVTVESRQK